MTKKILAINPGSTSTKISIFEGDKEVAEVKMDHGSEALAKYETVFAQKEYRAQLIADALSDNNCKIEDLAAVVGRGGLLKPIESGTYKVNDKMINELKTTPREHASNLGGVIAKELADKAGCEAFIVDPVVVDEMQPVARFTGSKHLERISVFHALNQKSVARQVAGEMGVKYEEGNFIVAHLGGGISVGAHRQGKVVDVNNALDGDGPFSPERTGGLPAGQWMEIALSGEYDKAQLKKMIKGEGGLMSLVGTSDVQAIEKKANEGDENSKLILEAMAYQVGKEIGQAAAVLCGKVNAIIVTGGIAYSPMVTSEIKRYVSFISDIKIVPGENEMEALAFGAKRVLDGEEEAKEY